MKLTRILAIAVYWALPAFSAYQYDFPQLLNPYNAAQWTANGTYSASNNLFTSSSSTGGSLIFNSALPNPSNSYEVRAKLALTNSGGNYYIFLRGTANALQGSGTWYGVEVTNPTFSGGFCNAGLYVLKSISGRITLAGTTVGVPCHDGMVVRAVMTQVQYILVYIDNMLYYYGYDSSISSGQPGIAADSVPAGNGISAVDIGHLDTVAPNAVSSIADTSFRNRVELQWPAATDDPNGIGVGFYDILRDGTWIGQTAATDFSDLTVVPNGSYVYTVCAIDYHLNYNCKSINVATAASSIDPREVGVRPTGSYWGGGGEQIDMLSGNLNYSMPLIKALGRGGWGVAFNLSYNSQNWRQDPSGTWQLGLDTGCGYGWHLQAGSLTPLYAGAWNLDGYLFVNSNGAEYMLNVNTNGVWTSQESIYVFYDSNAGRLYFPDGSFWTFGVTAALSEQDSGTKYPTLMEDSNGNQIVITYNSALVIGWGNASSRINTIEDVRGNGFADYSFTYNTDLIPHLVGITNTINTSENYTLQYGSSTLNSPFSPSSGYGTWSFLQSVVQSKIPLTTSFNYDPSGTGELNQVTTPYGGHLRWAYAQYTLSGGRTFREVQNRYLSTSSGASETSVQLTRSANDSSLPCHSSATLDDASASAEKVWDFQTGYLTRFDVCLPISYWENQLPSHMGLLVQYNTWAQTPTSLNPYISSTLTVLDLRQRYQALKQNTQTLDQYGNLTQMKVYTFSNLSTPARTYTNTYLYSTDPNYASHYILNKLASSTVTDGTNTTTLALNYYDQCAFGLTNVTGLHEHDDANYGQYTGYRGNLTLSVTPATYGTTCYDIAGNVTGSTVNGVTTTATTNSSTNYAAPSQITTNTLSSQMTWSSFLGLNSATGPNGDGSSIVYDANARPSQTTSPYGAVTTFAYNDSVLPAYKLASTNGHWTETIMDGFGRTTSTVTGYGSTAVSTVDTVYSPCGCSPLGKMSQTSRPYAPGNTEYWTTYTYDASGRTTKVTLPDGSFTTYVYQGNTVTVTDPAGNWKKFTMDAFSNLTSVQEPDPALGTVTTSYTYDILNHLTQVSMPRGSATQTRTFNYASGSTVGAFLLSATNPENGTVTYTYNPTTYPHGGLLASKTDNKGQQLTYQYDSYNRLSSVTWANAPGGAQVLRTYSYDTNPVNSTFTQYGAGRLTAIQYAPQTGGQISFVDMYSYTQGGLVSDKRLQVNETVNFGHGNSTASANLDVTYTYNNEGKMTAVTYPTTYPGGVNTPGAVYDYTYDGMMRLSGMTAPNGNPYYPPTVNVVANVSYGPSNELTGMSYWTNPYGYQTSETRTYNNLGQLTNLLNSNPGSGTLNLGYVYPTGANNGKISSQQDLVSGEQVAYTYDSLNRVISAVTTAASDQVTTPWGQGFSYDGFGNLTAKTVLKGSVPPYSVYVDPGSNEVYGTTYDANGNAYPYAASVYDAENRLTYLGSTATSYGYDAQNKRIYTSGTFDSYGNPTGYTVVLYSPGGQKVGTYQIAVGTSLATTLVSSDVYFGSRRISAMDRLGSVGKFYPYGEAKGGTNPADTWSFATYWRDSATNLDYANNRYYTSAGGRFMTPDPYKAGPKGNDPMNPQSWNKYAYVLNDPVNFKDPQGLFGESAEDDEGPPESGCLYNGVWIEGCDIAFGGNSFAPQTAFSRAINRLNSAAQAFEDRTSFSQNCQNDIAAIAAGAPSFIDPATITIGTLQAAASSTTFVNGVGSQVSQAALYPNSPQAASLVANQTIGALFSNPTKLVTAVTALGGSTVYINPAAISGILAVNEGLLMHEMLHELGLQDSNIGNALHSIDPSIKPDASGNWTNTLQFSSKLSKDCFTGKGNQN